MVSHTESDVNSTRDASVHGVEDRVVRGPTKGKGTYNIWKRTNKTPLKVSVDAGYNNFVGLNASKFVSELGSHVKADAPVEGVTGWGGIDSASKDIIILSSLQKFEIVGGINDDVMKLIHKKCSEIYTLWRSNAKKHYEKALGEGFTPSEKPYPSMKGNGRYEYLINHVWNSDKFKKRSAVNKQNRGNVKNNHTMGSKSYAAALYALRNEDECEIPDEIDYIEFYKSSQYNEKTGKWVNQRSEENYKNLRKNWDEAKEAGIEISIEDLFQQVLGKEFTYFGKKSSSTKLSGGIKQNLEEMQMLEDKVNELTKTSGEKFEEYEKTIEALNNKVEEYKKQQFELMKSIFMCSSTPTNGSFTSMLTE